MCAVFEVFRFLRDGALSRGASAAAAWQRIVGKVSGNRALGLAPLRYVYQQQRAERSRFAIALSFSRFYCRYRINVTT